MALEEVKGERLEVENKSFSVFKGFPYNLLEVQSLALTAEEKKLALLLSKAISGKIGISGLREDLPKVSAKFADDFFKHVIQQVHAWGALEKMPLLSQLDSLKSDLTLLLAGFFPKLEHHKNMASLAVDNSIGFGVLSPLLHEASLEEIMVNGLKKAVFVIHRRHGMCKTNLVFSIPTHLHSLVTRIARSVGKPFDEDHPLLDARLSDGSRVNATISTVTPDGSTLTIRKFFKIPLSMVNLIENGTISSEAAAFLWLMVEGLGLEPMNLIVTGGTSSGKTTTLNALASFSRFSDRIVSIEDTLELDLGDRENWVRMEARPKSGDREAVSMDDLLRNALRMRPDRLIVGEVRGEEAQTMFVAMDTGHRGLLGTLHSNTAREMLLRLQQAPMNVAEVMVPLLNLVVVQVKLFLPGKGVVRRVSQIAELSPLEGKPLQATLFQWQRSTDHLKRTETPSHVFELLSERTSLSKNDLKKELLVRQRILEWMVHKGIMEHDDVADLMQHYYSDSHSIIHRIQQEEL
ncbi:Flp pilus assembly complex ATPase component TadA [Candidatus Micrarchaeota archaeon]|nr:Flp pilus assembly complex ATPase component TadA [Candidatus Micrarchaeota archaeon]MBU1930373.1 Flp pilus assembly complex ATPase component TadA [Candidatus Micrarchaeota archaeon]